MAVLSWKTPSKQSENMVKGRGLCLGTPEREKVLTGFEGSLKAVEENFKGLGVEGSAKIYRDLLSLDLLPHRVPLFLLERTAFQLLLKGTLSGRKAKSKPPCQTEALAKGTGSCTGSVV